MFSCVLFLLCFFHCHFLLPPFCALVSSFSFPLSVGVSDSCQIFKASPCTLFPCISMRWWALNNIYSQQTFKRAWLASYMMAWCAVLLLGVLVFWHSESEPKQRERALALAWRGPNSVLLWRVRKCEMYSLILSCFLALSGFLSSLSLSFFFCFLHCSPHSSLYLSELMDA